MSDALDSDFVRRQFPGIDDWAFFENAGGSLVPQTVIDRVRAQNGVVRASMVHYNTAEEVDRLIRGLDEAI